MHARQRADFLSTAEPRHNASFRIDGVKVLGISSPELGLSRAGIRTPEPIIAFGWEVERGLRGKMVSCVLPKSPGLDLDSGKGWLAGSVVESFPLLW
jgi:hypothetical protein